MIIVGVAGGSGSGKTTLATALAQHLPGACVLGHDRYYRDQAQVPPRERARKNYDHPGALETALLIEHLTALRRGEPVAVPVYDYTRHTRIGSEPLAPPRLLIVEGILALTDTALRAQYDLAVFVALAARRRIWRRTMRDVQERGRTWHGSLRQYFAQTRPMHRRYIAPMRTHAHLIIDGGAPARESVARIEAALAARGLSVR